MPEMPNFLAIFQSLNTDKTKETPSESVDFESEKPETQKSKTQKAPVKKETKHIERSPVRRRSRSPYGTSDTEHDYEISKKISLRNYQNQSVLQKGPMAEPFIRLPDDIDKICEKEAEMKKNSFRDMSHTRIPQPTSKSRHSENSEDEAAKELHNNMLQNAFNVLTGGFVRSDNSGGSSSRSSKALTFSF